MDTFQDQLKKPLYKNWVKGGLAYKYLKDGLETFTDDAVHEEHSRILEDTKKKNIEVCNKCSLNNLKPKHEKEFIRQTRQYSCPFRQTGCNCLYSDKIECPKGFCNEIHNEILTNHASSPPAPNWKNTHISEWGIGPWEIAKCFINAPGYIDKKTVNDIDIAGILHVFINNMRLHPYLDCLLNHNDIINKTLQGRNMIFHSPSMELTLDDFTATTDNMISLLKDKKGLYLNENAQKAVENIKQLKKNDISITTQNEAEVFKVVTISNKERTNELKEIVENAELEPVSEVAGKDNNDDVAQSPTTTNTYIRLLELRCDQFAEQLNLMKKSLEEIKQLEQVRNAQQNTLKYISQKQELQKKLIKLYQNEQVKTWISPLATRDNNINIGKVYVHPKMYIEDSEDTISDYTERKIQNYHEIFCDIQNDTSQREDIIEQASDTQQKCHNKLKNIYIIGEVGTGKSAFCKMLINSWCDSLPKPNAVDKAFSENCLLDLHKVSTYDFLFYVQMCDIPGDIIDVMQMVIHSMYGIASDSLIKSIFSKESERCLIIIDGLDEWSLPEQPRRSQRHIKTGIPLSNNVNIATVLTTSSPSAKGILNLKRSQYDRKIKLVGIDENEIQNMIKLYMEAFDESLKCNADKDLDFINELKAANFPHPERTPLLLQQVLHMYCKGKPINKSITDIYTNNLNIMFAWSEEKEIEPMEEQKNVPDDLNGLKLPEALLKLERFLLNQELVLMLGKLAYHTVVSVSPSVMFGRSTFKECDIPYDALSKYSLMIGILVKENCPDPNVDKTRLLFTHISVRNYFAAVYISCHFDKDSSTSKTTKLVCPILDQLFERYNSIEKFLQLSGMLTMVCGLNPRLTKYLSKYVYDIVLTDSSRTEYITELEEGRISYHGLKETQEVQNLASKMFSESQFTSPEKIQGISMVDIVLRNQVNLSFVRQIIPETVQSLYIDKCLLNEDTIGVISRLNHIQILALTTTEISKSIIKPSVLLQESDSLIQAVLYNEDLDIELSHHVNLRSITLDKCKHISFSPKSSDLLRTCEIHGLVFSHGHFQKLISLLAQTKTLALRNIKCDMDGCKAHHIDLSNNSQLQTFVLEDCNYTFPIVSITGGLKSITIRRCRLPHDQYQNILLNIGQITSLCEVEIDSLICDDDCKGHDIDLSGQQHLGTLCLKNCRNISFKSNSGNEIKCLTIRNCRFSHTQCQKIARLLSQSVSLEKLELSHNRCSEGQHENHMINLSSHKQLKSIQYMDDWLYPNRLKTDHIERLVNYVSKVQITLPQNLSNATTLTEFKIEAVSKNALYNKQISFILYTCTNLQRFELCRVDIDEEALTVSSKMKNLEHIKLWVVHMSQGTWHSFLKSLGKLSQNVNIKTISIVVTFRGKPISPIAYVDRNAGKFHVTEDFVWNAVTVLCNQSFCYFVKR